jgi:hypothetical protein
VMSSSPTALLIDQHLRSRAALQKYSIACVFTT